jgi:hypothetical protein
MDNDIDCYMGEDVRQKPPFGQGTVDGFVGQRGEETNNIDWRCRCTCGVEREVAVAILPAAAGKAVGIGRRP